MGAAGYVTGQDVSGEWLHHCGMAVRVNLLVEVVVVELEEEEREKEGEEAS